LRRREGVEREEKKKKWKLMFFTYRKEEEEKEEEEEERIWGCCEIRDSKLFIGAFYQRLIKY
jgi:hypothetical protein